MSRPLLYPSPSKEGYICASFPFDREFLVKWKDAIKTRYWTGTVWEFAPYEIETAIDLLTKKWGGCSLHRDLEGITVGSGAMSSEEWKRKKNSNAFSVLHLTPDAPVEVIKATYKALCLLHHPDRNGNLQTMQFINNAMDCIKNERGIK